MPYAIAGTCTAPWATCPSTTESDCPVRVYEEVRLFKSDYYYYQHFAASSTALLPARTVLRFRGVIFQTRAEPSSECPYKFGGGFIRLQHDRMQ
eukprot:1355255-Rhodomonas_salina.3